MNSAFQQNSYALDTMGLVLRLEKRKSGLRCKHILEAAEAGEANIFIPALVFAEILYLSERNRIRTNSSEVSSYLNQFPSYHEQPLTLAIAQKASEIRDIPELHDRIIAATACFLKIPLITNDPVIQASKHLDCTW